MDVAEAVELIIKEVQKWLHTISKLMKLSLYVVVSVYQLGNSCSAVFFLSCLMNKHTDKYASAALVY